MPDQFNDTISVHNRLQASILSVGDEVLSGYVVNSNATWIAKQLSALNIWVSRHYTVADDTSQIAEALQALLKQSNIVILTGGLGPTPDDVTVAGMAECFKTTLVSDVEQEERIRAYFSKKKLSMPENNLKQALRPLGSQAILNTSGTAPGIYWEIFDNKDPDAHDTPRILAAFPGIPRELYAMWPLVTSHIKAYKTRYFPTLPILASRNLYFSGIGESQLVHKISDLFLNPDPLLATYVSNGVIRLQLSTKGFSKHVVEQRLNESTDKILEKLKSYHIATDGNGLLEEMVATVLTENHWCLSVAESCTGGLISHCLTNVSGSSAYTRLNVVTYGNDEKSQLLGVSVQTLSKEGAVSEAVARQMAKGILNLSRCHIGLGITGIAGPSGGSKEKPVGLAYVAIALAQNNPEKTSSELPTVENCQVLKIMVNPEMARTDIKQAFCQQALLFLLKTLQEQVKQKQVKQGK